MREIRIDGEVEERERERERGREDEGRRRRGTVFMECRI